jgi:hypothetical protein
MEFRSTFLSLDPWIIEVDALMAVKEQDKIALLDARQNMARYTFREGPKYAIKSFVILYTSFS